MHFSQLLVSAALASTVLANVPGVVNDFPVFKRAAVEKRTACSRNNLLRALVRFQGNGTEEFCRSYLGPGAADVTVTVPGGIETIDVTATEVVTDVTTITASPELILRRQAAISVPSGISQYANDTRLSSGCACLLYSTSVVPGGATLTVTAPADSTATITGTTTATSFETITIPPPTAEPTDPTPTSSDPTAEPTDSTPTSSDPTTSPTGCVVADPIVGCVFGSSIISADLITEAEECPALCAAIESCVAYQIGTDEDGVIAYCETLNLPQKEAYDEAGSAESAEYCADFTIYDVCPAPPADGATFPWTTPNSGPTGNNMTQATFTGRVFRNSSVFLNTTVRAINSTTFLGSGIITLNRSRISRPAQITTFRNISLTRIQSSSVLDAQNQLMSTPTPFFANGAVRESASVFRPGFQESENGLFALNTNSPSESNNARDGASSGSTMTGGQRGSMVGTSGGSVSTEFSSLLTSIDSRTTFSSLNIESDRTASVTAMVPTSSGIFSTGTTMTSGASSSLSIVQTYISSTTSQSQISQTTSVSTSSANSSTDSTMISGASSSLSIVQTYISSMTTQSQISQTTSVSTSSAISSTDSTMTSGASSSLSTVQTYISSTTTQSQISQTTSVSTSSAISSTDSTMTSSTGISTQLSTTNSLLSTVAIISSNTIIPSTKSLLSSSSEIRSSSSLVLSSSVGISTASSSAQQSLPSSIIPSEASSTTSTTTSVLPSTSAGIVGCTAISGCFRLNNVIRSLSGLNAQACRRACDENANCQSFVIGSDQSTYCDLLNVPAAQAVDRVTTSMRPEACGRTFILDKGCDPNTATTEAIAASENDEENSVTDAIRLMDGSLVTQQSVNMVNGVLVKREEGAEERWNFGEVENSERDGVR